MIRTISAAALLAAQPVLAQDSTVSTNAPAAAAPAPAPAHHMSLAEKLAIAAGVIGAGVVAVKALKGSSNSAAAAPTQAPATQPTVQ